MEEFSIYFNDLKPEIQQQLLEFYGIKSPAELNLDVFELCVLTKEDEENKED